MTIYGYARVSTQDQRLDGQIEALKAAGGGQRRKRMGGLASGQCGAMIGQVSVKAT